MLVWRTRIKLHIIHSNLLKSKPTWTTNQQGHGQHIWPPKDLIDFGSFSVVGRLGCDGMGWKCTSQKSNYWSTSGANNDDDAVVNEGERYQSQKFLLDPSWTE